MNITVGDVQKREKVGNNNGKLRIATPPRVMHAKPPGPKMSKCQYSDIVWEIKMIKIKNVAQNPFKPLWLFWLVDWSIIWTVSNSFNRCHGGGWKRSWPLFSPTLWSKRLACATRGGWCKRSWPLFSPHFSASFYVFYFSPTLGKLPWLKICFPQYFDIARRNIKKLF